MAVKVHLVDGTFELFRCFHGAPRHTNAQGEEVGAVRGLLHTLLSLLKGDDVSHVAVAFDALPAARGPMSDEPGVLIRRQAPLALEAVRALGIRLWPMVRFQADDALATGARVLRDDPGVEQVVLCTADTDLFQCIRGERVVALNRISKTITDEVAFRARYGVAPAQFPDYLALVGASAKGLPGVPRWGRRTTAAMLGRYGTIERIPADTADWGPRVAGKERLAEELLARRDEALLVKRLATLRDDLAVDCSPSALTWRGLDEPRLADIVARIEATDLFPRIERWRPEHVAGSAFQAGSTAASCSKSKRRRDGKANDIHV